MGNSCCNERGDREGEVLKSTQQKREDFAFKDTESDLKLVQASNLTHPEVNDFKEPSSYFQLTAGMLKAIERHGFFSPITKENSFPNTKFEGRSQDGRPFKYFGQMNSSSKEGRGQLQFLDKGGEFLVASFEQDKPVGESAIYFSNGDYFKGKIAGNSMQEGTLLLSNGNRYEGTFLDNMFEGQGTFVFADKRKYKGGFKQGKKSGFGQFTWTNGSAYEGEWLNGHQHGHGKFTDEKAHVHEGEFVEGKLLKGNK